MLLLCGIFLSVAANSVGTGLSYGSTTFLANATVNLVTLLPFSVVGAIIAASPATL